MRTLIVAFALALVTAFLGVVPVSAILYGVPDGNDHPFVGLVAFYDAEGQRLFRCSGTLLSPTVLLTAGRCTEGTASARVWFGPEPVLDGYPDAGAADGAPFTHPKFDPTGFPNRRDVGVVVPAVPVDVPVYGEPRPAGEPAELGDRRLQRPDVE